MDARKRRRAVLDDQPVYLSLMMPTDTWHSPCLDPDEEMARRLHEELNSNFPKIITTRRGSRQSAEAPIFSSSVPKQCEVPSAASTPTVLDLGSKGTSTSGRRSPGHGEHSSQPQQRPPSKQCIAANISATPRSANRGMAAQPCLGAPHQGEASGSGRALAEPAGALLRQGEAGTSGPTAPFLAPRQAAHRRSAAERELEGLLGGAEAVTCDSRCCLHCPGGPAPAVPGKPAAAATVGKPVTTAAGVAEFCTLHASRGSQRGSQRDSLEAPCHGGTEGQHSSLARVASVSVSEARSPRHKPDAGGADVATGDDVALARAVSTPARAQEASPAKATACRGEQAVTPGRELRGGRRASAVLPEDAKLPSRQGTKLAVLQLPQPAANDANAQQKDANSVSGVEAGAAALQPMPPSKRTTRVRVVTGPALLAGEPSTTGRQQQEAEGAGDSRGLCQAVAATVQAEAAVMSPGDSAGSVDTKTAKVVLPPAIDPVTLADSCKAEDKAAAGESVVVLAPGVLDGQGPAAAVEPAVASLPAEPSAHRSGAAGAVAQQSTRQRSLAHVRVPKLPMVLHQGHWYRARVLRDNAQRVLLEVAGFEELTGAFWLPRDSDRIWRGSYKGRDWRHLGGGAWEPKSQRNGSRPVPAIVKQLSAKKRRTSSAPPEADNGAHERVQEAPGSPQSAGVAAALGVSPLARKTDEARAVDAHVNKAAVPFETAFAEKAHIGGTAEPAHAGKCHISPGVVTVVVTAKPAACETPRAASEVTASSQSMAQVQPATDEVAGAAVATAAAPINSTAQTDAGTASAQSEGDEVKGIKATDTGLVAAEADTAGMAPSTAVATRMAGMAAAAAAMESAHVQMAPPPLLHPSRRSCSGPRPAAAKGPQSPMTAGWDGTAPQLPPLALMQSSPARHPNGLASSGSTAPVLPLMSARVVGVGHSQPVVEPPGWSAAQLPRKSSSGAASAGAEQQVPLAGFSRSRRKGRPSRARLEDESPPTSQVHPAPAPVPISHGHLGWKGAWKGAYKKATQQGSSDALAAASSADLVDVAAEQNVAEEQLMAHTRRDSCRSNVTALQPRQYHHKQSHSAQEAEEVVAGRSASLARGKKRPARYSDEAFEDGRGLDEDELGVAATHAAVALPPQELLLPLRAQRRKPGGSLAWAAARAAAAAVTAPAAELSSEKTCDLADAPIDSAGTGGFTAPSSVHGTSKAHMPGVAKVETDVSVDEGEHLPGNHHHQRHSCFEQRQQQPSSPVHGDTYAAAPRKFQVLMDAVGEMQHGHLPSSGHPRPLNWRAKLAQAELLCKSVCFDSGVGASHQLCGLDGLLRDPAIAAAAAIHELRGGGGCTAEPAAAGGPAQPAGMLAHLPSIDSVQQLMAARVVNAAWQVRPVQLPVAPAAVLPLSLEALPRASVPLFK